MTALALFASTYILVMALGLQSLNVNGGHYRAAFLNSFVIGASNLVLYKLAPDANTIEIAAYLTDAPSSSHGGARKGAGRPATGSKQIGVTLDPATVEKARQIGAGNVSEGLRRAVAAYYSTGI